MKIDTIKLAREAAIVDEQFEAVMKSFKPQFGNADHISVTRHYHSILVMKAELSRKIKDMKSSPALVKEIVATKQRIINLLTPDTV